MTDAVLSRAEFAAAQPSWLERIFREISDFIARFFRLLDVDGSGGRGATIGTVTLVVIAIVVIVVVLRFTRTVRRDRGLDVAVEGAVGRPADRWLADAREHEAAGQWRDALRCHYRAMVATFAAEGLLEEVPGRTTGEYLRAVEGDVPAAADAFRSATRRFESAWYGRDDVRAEDIAAFAATALRAVDDAQIRRPAMAAS